MSTRSTGYPIVSQSTLTAFMARYLATSEGQDVAKQFAAAGVQSYFMANPINGTIANAVAAYLVANPPANGQNATATQVQQAVDAYYAAYPPDTVTDAELASAVAAYLRANPPQQGATGPAGQNATAAQVAEAVNAYMAANPLSAAVASAVAAYMAANPSQRILTGTVAPTTPVGNVNDYYIDTLSEILYGPKSAAGVWPVTAYIGTKDVKTGLLTNNSGVWTKTYPANYWKASPSIFVTPRMGAGNYVARVQTTGTSAGGFTVTVTWSMLALNLMALGGALTVAISSPVTFDLTATEPTP